MIFSFFKHQFNFFDRFDEQVGHAVDAAAFFTEVVTRNRVSDEMLSRMALIEHRGDNVAHTILAQLNKTFITPFDREDIHALSMETR